MFTGIVTDLGRVRAIAPGGITRLTLETGYDTGEMDHGASVCCSGVCLSVVDKGPGWFAVEASNETLACTTVGEWQPGRRVNFERPLRMGDELGGHIVSGHVDGVGTVVERRQDGESWRFGIEAPAELADYIAPKGSVAVDGVSLTVNEVAGNRFGVNIIPVTRERTTFGTLHMGERVNLEIDPLARYVARLMERKRG